MMMMMVMVMILIFNWIIYSLLLVLFVLKIEEKSIFLACGRLSGNGIGNIDSRSIARLSSTLLVDCCLLS